MENITLTLSINEADRKFLSEAVAIMREVLAVGQASGSAPATTMAKTTAPAKKANAEKASEPVITALPEDDTFDLGDVEPEAKEEVETYTLKDVIAACRTDKTKAVKVLKKFKVKSVHDLKANQYGSVIHHMGA